MEPGAELRGVLAPALPAKAEHGPSQRCWSFPFQGMAVVEVIFLCRYTEKYHLLPERRNARMNGVVPKVLRCGLTLCFSEASP